METRITEEQIEGLMQRLIFESGFRERLEQDPVETLSELGIDASDPEVLRAIRGEEGISREAAVLAVAPLVSVGTRPAVNVAVESAVATAVVGAAKTAVREVSTYEEEGGTDIEQS